jgi:hypothetical protein
MAVRVRVSTRANVALLAGRRQAGAESEEKICSYRRQTVDPQFPTVWRPWLQTVDPQFPTVWRPWLQTVDPQFPTPSVAVPKPEIGNEPA